MPGILPDPSRLYLSELSHAQRALLLAIRALLDPAECRGWVMWEFGRLFPGEASALAFAALRGFVRLLAADARRSPRVHGFEDDRVAPDEHAVLVLCAALQARRHDHAEALLRWLLPTAVRPAALNYAVAVAGMMAENGARLPWRRAAPLMRLGPIDADADIGDQRHA